MKKFGYIYITTNTINGKIYIGKHEKSFYEPKYFGSGILLNRAIKKYGKENFENHIIEWCENKEKLNHQEKYWIRKYNSLDRNYGYNIASGGDSGNLIQGYTSYELKRFKKKMSEVTKGENNPMYDKHHSEVTRKKISLARNSQLMQYTKTAEFRDKISKAVSGKNNPMYGKKHSDEAKQRISQKNKINSKGEKNGMYGKKGENAINGKKIGMYNKNGELIKIFNTKSLALQYLNLKNHISLTKACKNGNIYKNHYWKEII